MTAPCGLPCFECYLYLAQFDQEMTKMIAGVLNLSTDEIKCKGCRAEDGQCGHLAMKPHNTKVFNLCRIKNVGIEKWAKEEAGDILDKYYYGTWTL